MFNPKKTTRKVIHESEATYSGTVAAVTPKTIVVFIPALDVVPQQDIREDIPLNDEDFFDDDLEDEEAEEYDWYNEPPVEDFGNLDID